MLKIISTSWSGNSTRDTRMNGRARIAGNVAKSNHELLHKLLWLLEHSVTYNYGESMTQPRVAIKLRHNPRLYLPRGWLVVSQTWSLIDAQPSPLVGGRYAYCCYLIDKLIDCQPIIVESTKVVSPPTKIYLLINHLSFGPLLSSDDWSPITTPHPRGSDHPRAQEFHLENFLEKL